MARWYQQPPLPWPGRARRGATPSARRTPSPRPRRCIMWPPARGAVQGRHETNRPTPGGRLKRRPGPAV